MNSLTLSVTCFKQCRRKSKHVTHCFLLKLQIPQAPSTVKPLRRSKVMLGSVHSILSLFVNGERFWIMLKIKGEKAQEQHF